MFFETQYPPLLLGNLFLVGGFRIVLIAPTVIVAMVSIAITCIGFGTLLSIYRRIITRLGPARHLAGSGGVAEVNRRLMAIVTSVALGIGIAVAETQVDFNDAVLLAGLCAILLRGGGEIVCLLLARNTVFILRGEGD